MRRGFSLVTVLLVASVILVAGTAMAALSSVSLNMASQGLGRTRARAITRAVSAQIRFELDQRLWMKPGNPYGLPDMAYGRDAIRERFLTVPLFPDAGQQVIDGSLHVWLDFDRPDHFSVDNLSGTEAVAGYVDRGTARRSVPPFSLDLIVNTGVGSDRDHVADARHCETVITRVWPYAAYSLLAPLVVSGTSSVRGSLYQFEGGVFFGDTASPGATDVRGDVCLGASREDNPLHFLSGTLNGRVRYNVRPWGRPGEDPLTLITAPVLLAPISGGPQRDFSPQWQPLPDASVTATVNDFQFLLGRWAPDIDPFQKWTDELLAKMAIWAGSPLHRVTDLNPYRGRLAFRLPWDNQSGEADPNASFNWAKMLVKNLELENGYYRTDPITNHFPVMQQTSPWGGKQETDDLWTGDASGPATIRLTNAVLRVDGDLDIRDLWGDNSTLMVNGNLYLNGGSLDAGRKGLLILARNVFMRTRGDFRGLIAAHDNLWLSPLKSGEQLVLRGAIVAGGAARGSYKDLAGNVIMPPRDGALCIVNSTSLLYDSKYTTVLNRLGVARTLIFRELP